MAKLYELKGELAQLMALAYEIPEETETDAFKDTLEALQMELHDKADGYAMVIKNLMGDIEGLKNEENRIHDRRKALENRVDYLKRNLEDAMILADDKKFKTTLFSFNVQKNAPSVKLLVSESDVPEKYTIPQKPKVNNKLISEALKNGEELEWATLEQSESLRIR